MAGRTFQHVVVTFQRSVTEQQTVTVAVDPRLDESTRQAVARQLAPSRLKAKWDTFEMTASEIVDVEEA
jgi:hypothetical protein